ncbi:hypothetical protein MMC30_003330 [Trapelia coarctata]|nr:hypothetical protein [Trapelia coarctata]
MYYLKNILHEYLDDKCVELLKNTMAAMDKDSVIFIDELIMSNERMSSQAAEMDINLMSTLAGVEKTERQWHALLESAGLKI